MVAALVCRASQCAVPLVLVKHTRFPHTLYSLLVTRVCLKLAPSTLRSQTGADVQHRTRARASKQEHADVSCFRWRYSVLCGHVAPD